MITLTETTFAWPWIKSRASCYEMLRTCTKLQQREMVTFSEIKSW
jgi:hypothetical protein